MALPDINELNIEQLEQLIAVCQERIVKLKEESLDEAMKRLNAAVEDIEALGLPPELLPNTHIAFKGKVEELQRQKEQKAKRGRPKGTRVKTAPGDPTNPLNANFYDPESGDWHTGFGSRENWPDWLKLQKEDVQKYKLTPEKRDELIASGVLKRKDSSK
ncbi:MAG: hypothetical protein JAZ15_21730 [Candidatus Thiodiazotropha endolucinida]|nr:hypothetical protein [Candidatus Thiodiazotropha taylori]MCW4315638.1 hypothetical protein [Candidatus Thiodiazotropha taylori]